MALRSRPEPMNASSHHSKVKVTLTLSDPVFVAGGIISGKMEVESHADLDCLLGIGAMMVELHAIEGKFLPLHRLARLLTRRGAMQKSSPGITPPPLHSSTPTGYFRAPVYLPRMPCTLTIFHWRESRPCPPIITLLDAD